MPSTESYQRNASEAVPARSVSSSERGGQSFAEIMEMIEGAIPDYRGETSFGKSNSTD
jgi:hypothetical protein